MRFFEKISKIKYNKFIFYLILMISVDCRVRRLKENPSIFSLFTDNHSFVFVITSQKFYWIFGNIELIQLDLP